MGVRGRSRAGAFNPSPHPQSLLVEFYKGAPDLVKFHELWSQDQTYLDKLKVGRGLCELSSSRELSVGFYSVLSSPGLPGLPQPQGPELHPHPGADLRPAETQQLSGSHTAGMQHRLLRPGSPWEEPEQQLGAQGRAGGAPGGTTFWCNITGGNGRGISLTSCTQGWIRPRAALRAPFIPRCHPTEHGNEEPFV